VSAISETIDRLIAYAVRGSFDCFIGKPFHHCPHATPAEREAWQYGWRATRHLLDEYGAQEATRWLDEAAT
jgi:ribosome modulation factor